MALERSLTRLTLRPTTMCQHCRRHFTTSVQDRQQQRNATQSFTDSITQNRIPTTSATRQFRPQPSPTTRPARSNIDVATRMATEATRKNTEEQRLEQLRASRGLAQRADLERQMTRRWKVGDAYAPHDLSGVEMSKWKKFSRKPRPKYDVVDQLGLNPLNEYKNFGIMSEYVTEMGRIRHGNDTGLRPVNQRKMAKAIRRAIGIGLIPGVHRHPEILQAAMRRNSNN